MIEADVPFEAPLTENAQLPPVTTATSVPGPDPEADSAAASGFGL